MNNGKLSITEQWVNKALKRAEVYFCVCTREDIGVKVMQDCIGLSRTKHKFHWQPMEGDSLISRARSRAASNFLKTKCDVLFFLDDDVIFEPEDAAKIVDHVLAGKLICGGMYVKKGLLDPTLVLEQGDSMTFCKEAKPQKVVVASTGFLAIHRSVFEVMLLAKNSSGEPKYPLCAEKAPWAYYPFFTPEIFKMEDGTYHDGSEDWTFCLNARKLGVETWVDPSIFLGHKGSYVYTLADRLRPSAQKMDQDFKITIS